MGQEFPDDYNFAPVTYILPDQLQDFKNEIKRTEIVVKVEEEIKEESPDKGRGKKANKRPH